MMRRVPEAMACKYKINFVYKESRWAYRLPCLKVSSYT